MNAFLISFILAALIIAWYLGYRSRDEDQEMESKIQLPHDYLMGLNFLLNEEPDKAVDVFIKMLEVDSSTVETHLAVAKLFRRRGEVDRAIRIHQNLIARPQLETIFRDQSLFELGQDYLSAGVLDRAERIFLELVGIKSFSASALKSLLDIYQREKLWKKAIDIAKKLEEITKKNMHEVIAHYYCELAEEAFNKKQHDKANQLIQEALSEDRHCVRASLLLARLEMFREDYRSALRSLKRIKNQNPEYFSEAIDYLASCYEATNDEEKLISYLIQVLEEHPNIPIPLILAERIKKWKGEEMANTLIVDYVKRFPSLKGLQLYIEQNLMHSDSQTFNFLQHLLIKIQDDRPNYQCVHCGFSGKSLHWQCPECKQWSSIKPMHALETKVAELQ